MKTVIVALVTFFALAAHAEVSETIVQCTRDVNSNCAVRTVAAFENLGCNPVAQSIQCQDAVTDPRVDPAEVDHVRGKDFCAIQSDCHEPHYGNFGQFACGGGLRSGEQTLDLSRVDAGITLTTSVGLFRRYVTTLCK